ncbi:M24 family metallopeptidase [Desulfitobacterium metallireducens]|uniref:Peptidase M24 n=1 Tax=Desulfitobacterium metallireducens DSM 15288 TaxID=871968 RepID=W0E970_9FIRM|nr:Xaa-Pro peptidase family protein [Desulfitobacterium metallireducens]AHF07415.1 peptidase M24 [Desulfitobacterium metallireducens DSM 15288]
MSRLERIRLKMQEEKLDAFILASPENRRYMSGFTGTSAMLLITLEKAYLLTDFRYIQQATAQAPDFQVVKITNMYSSLTELAQKAARVGFEEEYTTYADYLDLKESLPQVELVPQSKLLAELRSLKDVEELEKIRQAVKLADDAFAHILQFVEVGQTEEEIALELEFAMRRNGASGASFDFIVASGLRSSMPHGVASPKKVQPGDFLTMDFGAIYQGYCSDITRTICFGEPTEKQHEIYEIVLRAQKAGIAALKPGISGREVDAVARGIIAEAGYGEYFGHGLGHSVGLAIHEGPNLNLREERILKPGMVITIEPGIYIPDWGGVRIEDMAVITENGCEVLTQAPKEFIIIE